MTKAPFQDWFCLVEGRRNFEIDPAQDRAFLFGGPSWQEEIVSKLQMAETLGTPLRLVWWGQYGIGKTHRLRHMEYLIREHEYPYWPCFVVATDIYETTAFDRLHHELVSSLGRDRMRGLVGSYLLKLRNQDKDVPPLEEICGQSSNVQAAVRSFGSWDNPQLELPAWRFLTGLKLKSHELDLANVTRESLTTSLEYAAVLRALATVIELETGNQLLYLVDEVEHMTKITNRIMVARWQEALRAILDIKNLGLVVAVGAEQMEGLPKVILMPDIVRRFQRENYLPMAAFKPSVVKRFLKGLLDKWIDGKCLSAAEKQKGLGEAHPDYDRKFYPFTKSGFDLFCTWSVVDPRSAKPSEIISRLNWVAFEAYKRNHHLITTELLADLGAPQEKVTAPKKKRVSKTA